MMGSVFSINSNSVVLKALSKSDSEYEMTLLIIYKQLISAIERPFKKPVWWLSIKFCNTALRGKAISLAVIL